MNEGLWPLLDRIAIAVEKLEAKMKNGLVREFSYPTNQNLRFGKYEGRWRITLTVESRPRPIVEATVSDRIWFAQISGDFYEKFQAFRARAITEYETLAEKAVVEEAK